MTTDDLSGPERLRAARQQHWRAEIERLEGLRARSRHPKTQARLTERIRIAHGRLRNA